MASTGKTQGIRFRIMPPSSAPSKAASRLMEDGAAGRAAGVAAALAFSAAASAGDTTATLAAVGQSPLTGASMR